MTRKLPVLETEFEIIDRYICSHRFKTAEYWWAWRPKSGTVDETDYSMVDVFVRRTEKLIEQLEAADNNFDQAAPAFSFPFPARVGLVRENESLLIPKTVYLCRSCQKSGYYEL